MARIFRWSAGATAPGRPDSEQMRPGGASRLAAAGFQPADRSTPIIRFFRTTALLAAGILMISGAGAFAQQNVQAAGDFSTSAEWFPRFYKPYMMRTIPSFQAADSFSLQQLVSDEKILISLKKLKEAVRENNLDFLALEIDVRSVETDLLRVKGGGAPRGGGGVQIPSSLFSGAIGAGVGGGGGLGGFSAGGVTGGARQVSGFPRGSYDPTLAFGFSFG